MNVSVIKNADSDVKTDAMSSALSVNLPNYVGLRTPKLAAVTFWFLFQDILRIVHAYGLSVSCSDTLRTLRVFIGQEIMA